MATPFPPRVLVYGSPGGPWCRALCVLLLFFEDPSVVGRRPTLIPPLRPTVDTTGARPASRVVRVRWACVWLRQFLSPSRRPTPFLLFFRTVGAVAVVAVPSPPPACCLVCVGLQ